MNPDKIVLVRIGGCYLKAILPNREETVYGRDVYELAGRLKLLGFKQAMDLIKRELAA